MILYIDTTELNKIKLELRDKSTLVGRINIKEPRVSERLLFYINILLNKHRIAASRLSEVVVAPGPGPFSAIRSGVATANAIAFALSIPVREPRASRGKWIVLPRYNRAPNITKPKEKNVFGR